VIATLTVLIGTALLAARRLRGFNLTGDEWVARPRPCR